MLIVRRPNLYYTVSGIITPVCGLRVHRMATYMCDDTRDGIIQFWPPDDEPVCSKHVEAWNKLIVKQILCINVVDIKKKLKNYVYYFENFIPFTPKLRHCEWKANSKVCLPFMHDSRNGTTSIHSTMYQLAWQGTTPLSLTYWNRHNNVTLVTTKNLEINKTRNVT